MLIISIYERLLLFFYNQTIQTIIQLSIKDDRNLSRKQILIVNRSVIDLIFNFYKMLQKSGSEIFILRFNCYRLI